MRRIAVACAVFAVGVVAGIAALRPGHTGLTRQEQQAEQSVEAASGGTALRVSCAPDHCGVVVRTTGAARCQGWVVPVANGVLGPPRRAALAHC